MDNGSSMIFQWREQHVGTNESYMSEFLSVSTIVLMKCPCF